MPTKQKLIKQIKKACAAGLKTSTLGGRRHVIFSCDANGDYVKAGQSIYLITEELLDAVAERYVFLLKEGGINRMGYPYHLAAGQYNYPKWKEYPTIERVHSLRLL